AKIWDLASGEARELSHPQPVMLGMFSPDGTMVITAARDGMVRLWNTATGKPLDAPLDKPLDHSGQRVSSMAVSPDGSTLLTGCFGDGAVRFWDLKTGKALRPEPIHKGSVTAVAFSLQGKIACTAGDGGIVQIWDVASPAASRLNKLQHPAAV